MIAKVRDLVQRNLLVKVISLLTAIVLWLVVMNDQNPSIENNYTIPKDFMQSTGNEKMTPRRRHFVRKVPSFASKAR